MDEIILEATTNAKRRMLIMYERYLRMRSISSMTTAYRLLDAIKALHVYFDIIDYYMDAADKERIEITQDDILDLLEVVKKELLLEDLNNI
jgi:hypothetical protein